MAKAPKWGVNTYRARTRKKIGRHKKNRKKNPIAQVLKFFTPKVIKDKTKYNRKHDDQVWKKYFWKGL